MAKKSKSGDYRISFAWDDEACVWIATSEDIRGLVLEHESLDALMREVCLAVPELLDCDKDATDGIHLDFSARRHERLLCNA